MHMIKWGLLLFLLIVVFPLPAFAVPVGPYSGTVVDSRTGDPIEGASVLMYWIKAVPGSFEGPQSMGIKTALVYTGRDGKYAVARFHADTGLQGVLESTHILIYQPGYEVYIQKVCHAGPYCEKNEQFKDTENLARLDRLPPMFDHKAHIEKIERAFEYSGLSSDDTAIQKSIERDRLEFIKKTAWEERRANPSATPGRRQDQGAENDVGAVIRALGNTDFLTRINAAFTLGQLRAPKAVPALAAAIEENADWRNKLFQQECLIALRKINKSDTGAAQVLMQKIDDPYLKTEIIKTLGHFQVQEARELLVKATKDPDESIRTLALKALEQLVRTETKRYPVGLDRPVAVRIGKNGRKQYRVGPVVELGERTETRVIDYEGRLDVLLNSLKDPSPEVRATAAAGLGQIKNKDSVNALIVALKDSSPQVTIQAIESLGHIKDESAVQPLLQAARNADRTVQDKALQALKSFDNDDTLDGLLPLAGVYRAREAILQKAQKSASGHAYVYRDSGKRVISATAPRSLPYEHFLVHPVIVGKLLDGLTSGTADSKAGLLYLLREFQDERSEAAILTQLDDPDEQVREAACKALEKVGTHTATDKLLSAMKDPQPKVRAAAARAAGCIGDAGAFNHLIALLDDSSTEVKSSALSAIGKYDDPKCRTITIGYLAHPELAIRRAALAILIEKPDAQAVEHLLPLLHEHRTASLAAEALGKTKDSRAAEALIGILVDTNKDIGGRYDMDLRRKAAGLLGDMSDTQAIQPMLAILFNEQENRRLRIGCALSLQKIGDESAAAPLEEALAKKMSPDIERYVRDAHKAIQKRVMNAKLLADYADPELAPVVAELIRDPEKKVKNTAIGDMAKLRDKRAMRALAVVLQYDKCSHRQRYHALELLASYDEPEVIPILAAQIEDPNFYLGHEYIEKKFKGPQYKEIWESFAATLKSGTGTSTLRRNAVRFLAASDDPAYIPLLIELITDPDALVAQPAIKKFISAPDPRAIEPLIAVVKKGQRRSETRMYAVRALLKAHNDPAARAVYIAHMDDHDSYIAKVFLNKLGELQDKSAIPHMLKIIGRGEGKEGDFCNKPGMHCSSRAQLAEQALMKYHKDDVTAVIKGCLSDSDPLVRAGARLMADTYSSDNSND